MTTSPILHIDATSLAQVNLTGLGRCIARIIGQIAKQRPVILFSMAQRENLVRMGHRAELYHGQALPLGPENLPDMTQDICSWRDQVFALPTTRFNQHLASISGGIYTFHRSVKRRFAREVSLYYDLTGCIVPATHQARIRQNSLDLVARMAPLDDHAVAISQNTRRDLLWLCGLPPDRVSWTHLGPSQCVSHHASTQPVERDPNLFLAVSTLEPRKNPENLLRWFLNSPHLPPDARLIWAGPSGWLVDKDRLPRRNNNRLVTFAGMVSDAKICELYRQARCLVYISLYEGFGFPVLDALLHGTQVICSGNSSLLEFTGPGLHLCDPLDIASIDEAWRECRDELPGWNRDDLKLSCTWENVASHLERFAA